MILYREILILAGADRAIIIRPLLYSIIIN